MGNYCCRNSENIDHHVSAERYDIAEGATYLPAQYVSNESDKSEHLETENSSEGSNKFHRVRALYGMEALTPDDLSFVKGDLFLVKSKDLSTWIEAINLRTNERGFIPGNYVCLDDGLPESLDAYYPIDRLDAEKKLFLPGQVTGTYIVRPRASGGGYALSVLVSDNRSKAVKHFKVCTSSSGAGFYLSRSKPFPTIMALVEYYSAKKEHVPCKLTVPCPRQYNPPLQFRDFEVDRSKISRGRRLGNGEFGEVYEGTWNKQLKVAIKYRLATMDRDAFINEAKIMHKLHHDRLVQLMGVCTHPVDQPLMIITELMAKGSLLNFLKSDEGQNLTTKDHVLMITQISDGMKYLESQFFIHRDLRAANVLVDRDNSVKVADFGLARLLQNDMVYNSTTKFPVKWTAPEAMQEPHIFSIKSDVWSFGVVMYEIVSPGHTVYEGTPTQDVLPLLLQGYRMPNPVPTDKDVTKLYEIMLRCWDTNPVDRPSFQTLHREFCSWEFRDS